MSAPDKLMTTYDSTFFDYLNAGALRSARRVLPAIRADLHIDSVLDVGCGQGAWLSVWNELGTHTVLGIDGEYVDRSRLLIDTDDFQAHDLTTAFDVGRRFDLVQSLEVAEHLSSSSAATFIASLTRHGDLVLFSAAPKGQGGDHHINEQSYEYWRGLFRTQGYRAIDFVRPAIKGDGLVEPWYRYNTMLYASPNGFSMLSAGVQARVVPEDEPIPDVSPLLYRLRKRIIATLPVPVVTKLAKWKELAVARNLSTLN
jgi:cyclopropane fatty-acyl-phospholipid synthase-like methyltransferase